MTSPVSEIVPEIQKGASSKVLLNRGFMWLWIGQLLSQLADRVFIYVLMIVAYNLTKSLQGVSVPLLAFGIPSVLFASIAGVFVDRWDRKVILVASDFLRGALILLPIFGIANSIWGLFGVAFVVYTITQFFAPAESASIPEVVSAKDLLAANSLFLVTWMFSFVIGFGLGAPILSFFGERGALIVATALYFLSGVAVFFSPIRSRKRTREAVIRTVFSDLVFGFEFMARKSTIIVTLFKMFMVTSGLAAVSVLAFGYAKDVLGIGERNFGYLIFSAGLGMLIGIFLLQTLSKWISKGWMVVGGFLFTGIFLATLTGISYWVTAALLIFGLGVANTLINATLQTILQSEVPAFLRGRIFGAQNMLINSAFTLPPYLFALVADNYSVNVAIGILAFAMIATSAAGLFITKFKTV